MSEEVEEEKEVVEDEEKVVEEEVEVGAEEMEEKEEEMVKEGERSNSIHRIQQLLMIDTLNKLEIERNYFNPTKGDL